MANMHRSHEIVAQCSSCGALITFHPTGAIHWHALRCPACHTMGLDRLGSRDYAQTPAWDGRQGDQTATAGETRPADIGASEEVETSGPAGRQGTRGWLRGEWD